MKTGGLYFSHALFNTILSHSVRWCRDDPGMEPLLAPYDNGAAFSANAVRYLFEDIQQGRNGVPTVQALLLLSAQECGRGNRMQAWLYSGMAFRLIDDMGICVDGRRHEGAENYSTEDLEIRNRLFWSCYFWDKLISLYFGRTPLIQNSAMSPPRILSKFESNLFGNEADRLQWMTQLRSKPGRRMDSYRQIIYRSRRTSCPVSCKCVHSQRF